MDLVELLQRNVHKFAAKEALRFDGQGMTYAELGAEVRRGAGLLQSWGIAKGDRVGIMSLNTEAFVVGFFAAIAAGAVVVPLNHKLMAAEVDYILEHSEAKIFLFDGALAAVSQGLVSKVRKASLGSDVHGVARFETEAAAVDSFRPVPVSGEDLAELLYTSGTTGRPKGCLHTHENVLLAGIAGALAMKMDADDRLLMAMPIWHSSPLNNWFIGAQYVGATTVLLREYHPLKFLQAVQEERCTVYFGAPISYILPIQMVPEFDRFDLSSMRCWIYGGGPIAADVVRMLRHKYRSENFHQVYGMTEAGPTGTCLGARDQVAKAGSIGRSALPGADLRLITERGSDAGPGETGEIWLRANCMMKGYYRDPAATEQAFADGWYRTGDVARMDADGYLYIVDRTKDMIVTGGENVYSKEVEDAISGHPDVVEAAVIGRPHPDWGETVVAVVVARQGVALHKEQLKGFLHDRLARYKIPREFSFVSELPHTPTGKVMKYRLREEIAEFRQGKD